jgi:hypothetical protein
MTDALRRAGDDARRRLGFLSLDETAALAQRGVLVLDPFSTLVAAGTLIGAGTVLYPNVVLACRNGGALAVGADVQLFPGVSLRADGGRIAVGAGAEIGDEGGFFVSAVGAAAAIEIGGRARLVGGGSLSETCHVGAGAQILGRIAVRRCRLEAGGDYTEPDPDRRGAVLKGFGQARDLSLARGRVIQAFGIFEAADAVWQSVFHPPAPG